MPRATQEQSRPVTRSMTSSAIRRSARLRGNRNNLRHEPSIQPPSSILGPTELNVRRRTQKRRKPSSCEQESRASSSTHTECEQTEIDLLARLQYAGSDESRASSRVKELEGQLDIALQAKRELASRIKEHKNNITQLMLKHLEEYFTCPLCFEIMACPYTLIPRNCGHTFCATCILKWFFSRLHKGCGGWHEAVDCPLCRSALPLTPERTPRSTSCFPFTPNRTADVAIRGFINAISHELAGAPLLTSIPLSDWNEGGRSKREWFKRARVGNNEMAAIAAQWGTLKPTDFVNIKNRLEV